ncbi:MAG: hypothetical protein PHX61_04580 [Alphaproteobacteria bacterium]|nr:hypothetical protein [Alphaproteobacteria bacterium]
MSCNQTNSVHVWQKFSLVHFGSKHLSEQVRLWAEQNAFASLESCARQVWASFDDALNGFPLKNGQQEMTLLKGFDAYKYTLELMLGLKSDRIGEDHITRQMRERWAQFAELHPELESELRPVYTTLERDSHMIRAKIVNHMVPARHTKAIQLASGQIKGDNILVTGHLSKSGEPSDDFRDLLLFLCNNRNGKPLVNQVAISTATQQETNHILNWFARHQDQKRVHPEIRAVGVSYEDANIAVEVYDRIYMTSTMGKLPELEGSYREAWVGKMRQDNTLTILRGAPSLMGYSSEEWTSVKDSRTILPETIWDVLGKIKAHNDRLAANALRYAEYCAHTRVSGQSPSTDFISRDKNYAFTIE